MKNSFKLTEKARYFIYTLLALVLCVGCHSDNNHYTNKEVKEFCDFDMSKTDWKIAKMNNGKYVLVDKKYYFKLEDKGGKYVTGNDTCYLKMRAYKWWMNSVVAN